MRGRIVGIQHYNNRISHLHIAGNPTAADVSGGLTGVKVKDVYVGSYETSDLNLKLGTCISVSFGETITTKSGRPYTPVEDIMVITDNTQPSIATVAKPLT